MVDVLMEGKKTPSAKSKRMFYFHPLCFPIFVGGQKIVVSPLLRWASVTVIYPPEHSTFRGVPRISLDGNPGFFNKWSGREIIPRVFFKKEIRNSGNMSGSVEICGCSIISCTNRHIYPDHPRSRKHWRHIFKTYPSQGHVWIKHSCRARDDSVENLW